MTRKTTPQHSLAEFAQRGIDYFEREFDPAVEAYYRFFDSEEFPKECETLGFEGLQTLYFEENCHYSRNYL
jgi:hypothetical protein